MTSDRSENIASGHFLVRKRSIFLTTLGLQASFQLMDIKHNLLAAAYHNGSENTHTRSRYR